MTWEETEALVMDLRLELYSGLLADEVYHGEEWWYHE